jgi:hypothetical protein
MNKPYIPDFNPIKFEDIHKHNYDTFYDKENGKHYAMKHFQDNFLEKIVGFCPTCKLPYLTRWKLEPPCTKILLGTRCSSFWNSISKDFPQELQIKYCGHPEESGWISFEKSMASN